MPAATESDPGNQSTPVGWSIEPGRLPTESAAAEVAHNKEHDKDDHDHDDDAFGTHGIAPPTRSLRRTRPTTTMKAMVGEVAAAGSETPSSITAFERPGSLHDSGSPSRCKLVTGA